jgi:hypothetical protein
MKVLRWLWTVWLLILGITYVHANVSPAFAYGGRSDTIIGYDAGSIHSFNYDGRFVFSENDEQVCSACPRTIFGQFGKFLAAGGTTEQGGLNLFKFGDSTSTTASGWRNGDYFLNLPNQGSPAANWAQNSSALRSVMREGNPIYDSYIDTSTGQQILTGQTPTSSGRFLNAERQLLENKVWQYNPQTGAYHPPQ